jgi:hypothetical protein
MSTAYHPQSDGQTENANKTLEIQLRSRVNFEQTDWDEHLAAAELAYNNSKHATTSYSPFYLFYGREATLPLDLALAPLLAGDSHDNPTAAEEVARWRQALQFAEGNTKKAQDRQKKYADKHRRPSLFKIGDRVLLSTEHLKMMGEMKRTRKFTERFIGPYRIKRMIGTNACELELPSTMRIHPVINVSFLKEYHDGTDSFPDRPIEVTRPDPIVSENNGAPEWEVERILDHKSFERRGRPGVIKYLVKWKGYGNEENTYEPIENFEEAALDLVLKYNSKHNINLGIITVVLKVQSFADVVNRK